MSAWYIEFIYGFEEVFLGGVLNLLFPGPQIVVVFIVRVQECLVQAGDHSDVGVYLNILILELFDNIV